MNDMKDWRKDDDDNDVEKKKKKNLYVVEYSLATVAEKILRALKVKKKKIGNHCAVLFFNNIKWSCAHKIFNK